jgi:hypothetical protein
MAGSDPFEGVGPLPYAQQAPNFETMRREGYERGVFGAQAVQRVFELRALVWDANGLAGARL